MGVCILLSVWLSFLASVTLHDTELGVAACQLLLSYRHTQSYNNRSGSQWGWLCRPGSGIVTACCWQQNSNFARSKDLVKPHCEASWMTPAITLAANGAQHMTNKCAGAGTHTYVFVFTRKRDNSCTDLYRQPPCSVTCQTVLFSALVMQRTFYQLTRSHPKLTEFSAGFESCIHVDFKGVWCFGKSKGDTLPGSQGMALWKQTTKQEPVLLGC